MIARNSNSSGTWFVFGNWSLFADECGASLAEYALVVSLVAITCLVGMRLIGTSVKTQLTDVTRSFTAAVDGAGTGNGDGDGGKHGHGDGGNNGAGK